MIIVALLLFVGTVGVDAVTQAILPILELSSVPSPRRVDSGILDGYLPPRYWKISAEMQSRARNGSNFRNKGHKRSGGHVIGSETPLCGTENQRINLANFRNILGINKNKMTVIVEAGVTMNELVDFTISHGLVPKVLPEMKEITVGGAVVGSTLESSSFRYGEFSDICRNILLLGGDGNLVQCSAVNRHKNLFGALSGSYGTLGTVLCAEIECIPAKPFVLLNITADYGPSSLQDGFTDLFGQSNTNTAAIEEEVPNFVDAIFYPMPHTRTSTSASATGSDKLTDEARGESDQHMGMLVTIQGKMVSDFDSKAVEMYRPDGRFEEFYYEKLQSALLSKSKLFGSSLLLPVQPRNHKKTIQLVMPLKPYLFRYDRGAFWMAQPISFSLALILRNPMLLVPFFVVHNNPLCRFLFRGLLGMFTTKSMYQMLHLADTEVVRQRILATDVFLPVTKLQPFLQWLYQDNRIPLTTPLWLCPCRVNPPSGSRSLSFSSSSSSSSSSSKHASRLLSPVGSVHSGRTTRTTTNTNCELMIDVGLYGRMPNAQAQQCVAALDQWMLENNARKMLYSPSSFSTDEFWHSKKQQHQIKKQRNQLSTATAASASRKTAGMFDKDAYDSLRQEYGAEGIFPDLYAKTVQASSFSHVRAAAVAATGRASNSDRSGAPFSLYWRNIVADALHFLRMVRERLYKILSPHCHHHHHHHRNDDSDVQRFSLLHTILVRIELVVSFVRFLLTYLLL